MADVTYRGTWWSPSMPEHRVPGFLTISAGNEPRLSLIGAIVPVSDVDSRGGIPVIYGKTTRDEDVSLIDCYLTGTNFSIPGTAAQDFTAATIFIGIHINNREEPLFDRATIEYSFLTEWLDDRALVVPLLSADDRHVLYHPPENVTFDIQGMNISTRRSLRKDVSKYDSVTLQDISRITVRHPQLCSFDYLSNMFISPMADLLSFATMTAGRIQSVILSSEAMKRVLPEGHELSDLVKDTYKEVEAISLDHSFDNFRDTPTFREGVMLFSARDCRAWLGSLIEKWIMIHQSMRAHLALFLSAQNSPNLHIEYRFLALAQCLEGYHRARMNNEDLPKQDHRARVKSILTGVPDEYKEWVRNRIAGKHADEPTFLQRFLDIFEKYGSEVRKSVGDIEEFSKKVRDTRNVLTHLDSTTTNHSSIFQGSEMMYAIDVLSFLFRSCTLTELGFSDEQVSAFLQRNRMFNFRVVERDERRANKQPE